MYKEFLNSVNITRLILGANTCLDELILRQKNVQLKRVLKSILRKKKRINYLLNNHNLPNIL